MEFWTNLCLGNSHLQNLFFLDRSSSFVHVVYRTAQSVRIYTFPEAIFLVFSPSSFLISANCMEFWTNLCVLVIRIFTIFSSLIDRPHLCMLCIEQHRVCEFILSLKQFSLYFLPQVSSSLPTVWNFGQIFVSW